MRPFFSDSFAGSLVALVKIKWKISRYISILVISLVNIFYINYLIFCINKFSPASQLCIPLSTVFSINKDIFYYSGAVGRPTFPCKDVFPQTEMIKDFKMVWTYINRTLRVGWSLEWNPDGFKGWLPWRMSFLCCSASSCHLSQCLRCWEALRRA